MLTVESIERLRTTLRYWRKQGQQIIVVPTMGNLHAGHLALVEAAQKLADRVVATVFVNPMQFAAHEDFDHYPRTLADDERLLSNAKVDVLFAPSSLELYPYGIEKQTQVEVPVLSEQLCGAFRPGHFRGVCTIVCKLFNIIEPDKAIFGEKDYQQLVILKKMVADLFMSIEIHSLPTVREADGLAISSRNSYLSEAERRIAPKVFEALQVATQQLKIGTAFAEVEKMSLLKLESSGFRPDYFAIRRQEDLAIPTSSDLHLVILVAAWLGKTRLIDNVALNRDYE